MTEEERMAMILAGMKNPYTTPATTMESQVAKQLATIDPGKIPAYNRKQDLQNQAAQSTAGQASKLKNQAAYARGLRNTAMPKGQSVGPSGIYVNNIWDSAEAGLSRALGGYLEGQLSDDYAAIDTAESAKGAAALELEDVNTGEQRGFEKALADIKIEADAARAALDRTSREGIAATGEAGQNTRSAATIAAQNARNDATLAAQAKPSTYTMADGRNVTGIEQPGGILESIGKDGQTTGQFIDISGATPFNRQETVAMTPEEAAMQRVKDKNTVDPSQMEANADVVGGLLTSDYFDSSTGAFNPERWAGELAVGPAGEMVQATQQQMGTVMLGNMAQRMEQINLRPWTPVEIQTVTQDMPGKNSKYPAWGRWTVQSYLPQVGRKFDEAIAAGVQTPEFKQQYMRTIMDDAIEGARKNGMDLADLERLGVPKAEIVRYLRSLEENG